MKGKSADVAARMLGGAEKFQTDPHFRDYLLFYEYFHGDNGAGIGASHQTGWTGLVAKEIEIFRTLDARAFLEGGRKAAFAATDGRRSDGDAPRPGERRGERQADQHDSRRPEGRGRESLATPGHHTNERSAS
jgi:hypothetical protein